VPESRIRTPSRLSVVTPLTTGRRHAPDHEILPVCAAPVQLTQNVRPRTDSKRQPAQAAQTPPSRPNRSAYAFEWRYVREIEEEHPEAGGELDKLLGAVARGEFGAFDLVYEQLREPIHNQVRAVLRDPAQSEEVTQEVLLELWRTAFRYDPARGSAAAWAMTIARRRAIDRVRRTASSFARERRALAADPPWDQVGQAATEAHDRARLLRCLDSLTDRQREAITLAFYDGYTHIEVAAILDTPLGTVKARIRDALIKLRDAMLTEE